MDAQATATYAKSFPVISDIISNSAGWRPSLHGKVLQLTEDAGNDDWGENSGEQARINAAIRQKLWSLVHGSLAKTIGTRSVLQKIDQQHRQTELAGIESHLFPADNNSWVEVEESDDLSEDMYAHELESFLHHSPALRQAQHVEPGAADSGARMVDLLGDFEIEHMNGMAQLEDEDLQCFDSTSN